MRFLLALFAIIVAFLLLRSLLTPVVKAIVTLLEPAAERPHTAAPPVAGELKKDPVCGTFIAPELAVKQKFKGEVVHFCSEKCRDQYARTA